MVFPKGQLRRIGQLPLVDALLQVGLRVDLPEILSVKAADLHLRHSIIYDSIQILGPVGSFNRPAELVVFDALISHWEIENQLHWVLDMQFREDESRARADNSAENLNVLRYWAYNLLKAETSVRGSFSDKQFKCLLDEPFLDKILFSAFGS